METIKWIGSIAVGVAGVLFFGGLIMQVLLETISFIKSRVLGGSPDFGWEILNWSEIRGWRGAALYPMMLGILLFFLGLACWGIGLVLNVFS